MSYTFTILLALICARLIIETALHALNMRYTAEQANWPTPAIFGNDKEKHRDSLLYSLSKDQFAIVSSAYDAIVLIFLLLGGFASYFYIFFQTFIGKGLWAEASAVVCCLIVFAALSYPLDYWQHFKLEARFGFNRMSTNLWIVDQIKGVLLMCLIGIPLVACILVLWRHFHNYGWLAATTAVTLFQMLMIAIYPRVIVPIFNKLNPLKDDLLRQKLDQLAAKAGFALKDVFVIDGSKRSTHANAYFTGFGKTRTVVLFDTLVNEMNRDEIGAVFAHELGHYKLKHIVQRMAISTVSLFLFFGVLQFISRSSIPEELGFNAPYPATLLLAWLGSGLITFYLHPIVNAWSRRCEYAADAFSAQLTEDKRSLVGSLNKLHLHNLKNPYPHPIFSAVYYSHPTLPERTAAIEKL